MQLSEIRGVNTHYTCLLQKDERLVWRKKVTHIQGEKGELYLLRVRGQTPRPIAGLSPSERGPDDFPPVSPLLVIKCFLLDEIAFAR